MLKQLLNGNNGLLLILTEYHWLESDLSLISISVILSALFVQINSRIWTVFCALAQLSCHVCQSREEVSLSQKPAKSSLRHQLVSMVCSMQKQVGLYAAIVTGVYSINRMSILKTRTLLFVKPTVVMNISRTPSLAPIVSSIDPLWSADYCLKTTDLRLIRKSTTWCCPASWACEATPCRQERK